MSAGADLRDAGMQQTMFAIGIGDTWAERARAFIENLEPGHLFTADLLRENVGDPFRPAAVGMLVRRAAFDGLLVAEGFKQSERTERRAAVVRVWRRCG